MQPPKLPSNASKERSGTHEELRHRAARLDKAADKIYVTGKYWPKLFEIKIKDPAAAKPQ